MRFVPRGRCRDGLPSRERAAAWTLGRPAAPTFHAQVCLDERLLRVMLSATKQNRLNSIGIKSTHPVVHTIGDVAWSLVWDGLTAGRSHSSAEPV